MLAIIPRRVPPPTVCIHGALLRALKLQMPICLVVLPRTALLFEVVNDVGHGVALEHIALHVKRKRPHTLRTRIALQVIFPLGREGIEIQSPEVPVLPLFHRTRCVHWNRYNLFVATIFLQHTIGNTVSRLSEYHRMLRSRSLISQMIGENLQLSGWGKHRKNYEECPHQNQKEMPLHDDLLRTLPEQRHSVGHITTSANS